MQTSPQTIDLVVRPGGTWRGMTSITLLKDGEPPGLEKAYFAPDGAPPEHGRGYTQFYWRPDDSLWVSWGEQNRLRALARGKRKPFPAKVTTVPPVPGLRSHASCSHAKWASELRMAEIQEEMRRAALCQ
jgi:hypothetical protein